MSSSQFPWSDGFWKIKDVNPFLFVVEGEYIKMHNNFIFDYPNRSCFMKAKLVSGDFGPTSPEIYEMTGVDTYNLQVEEPFLKSRAVLSKGGTCIYKKSFFRKGIDVMEYLDEEQLELLKEDRDPEDAPRLPSYIKPTPGHMGKILLLCGPPGSGKSTTAHLMGRHHGYVYFEADCFNNSVNPFIDVNEPDPSLLFLTQKPLKGQKLEAVESAEYTFKIVGALRAGQMFAKFEEMMDPCINAMTKNISKLRQRIGGNWCVSWALFTRIQRDKFRQMFDSDIIIINLKMTEECARKRLASRHGGNAKGFAQAMMKMQQLFEDVGDDEMNAYNLTINENMSEDDVVAEALKIVTNSVARL